MSVDGLLLSDMRRLRAEPAALVMAVAGPKGCGKSFALRQFIKGSMDTNEAVQVHTLRDCLLASGVPDEEKAVQSPPTSSSSPPLLLAVFPKTLSEGCLSASPGASEAEARLRPGTVLVMDDIEALSALLSLSNALHHLQRLWLMVRRSTACRVVVSASDESRIPYLFRKEGRPLVYRIPALTKAAARRTVRVVAAAAPSFSVFENCGDGMTPSTTRRQLILSMTMAAGEHSSGDATHIDPDTHYRAPSLADHLRFLEGESDAAAGTAPHSTATTAEVGALFGLESILSRLGMLVSVFATGSAGAGGGKLLHSLRSTTGVLLHGPSGCGKSAIAREVARQHPHIPFTFVTCTSLFSKYLGESEEKLRDVYRAARATAPSVVVLDDVDVLAQSRQGGADSDGGGGKSAVSVSRRMLASLLCELDGLADNSGVLTIATTNAPHVLDSALLRQGRLETLLAVPPLSHEAAHAMSTAFFATFTPAEPQSSSEQPLQRDVLVEMVAQSGVGRAPTSLHYLLRKILERHLGSLQSELTQPSSDLPMPSTDCVQACLFECASVLIRVPYVDPFGK